MERLCAMPALEGIPIIVVDDASTDGTGDVMTPYARIMPVHVRRHVRREGYAASLEALLREAALASGAGQFATSLLDDVVYRRRHGFEYWGHAASFLPMASFRLCLPRMRRLTQATRGWWVDIRPN